MAASYGLSEFGPSLYASGSTAAALELVWTGPAAHGHVSLEGDSTVRLRVHESSPHSAGDLVARMRFPAISDVQVVGERELVVRFTDAAAARAFLDSAAFETGPYKLESQEPGRVVLRARGDAAMRTIEILEVPVGDQWKYMLGHRVDVLPTASGMFRSAFADMQGVRVVDLVVRNVDALAFNTEAGPVADASVRRGIAGLLDRAAIAAVACGAASCAEPWSGGEASPQLPELTLSLHVVEDITSSVRAAEVIRHQLRPAGIRVAIEAHSLADFVSEVSGGRFELALVPLPVDRHDRYVRFSKAGAEEGLNVARFESAELEAAWARADFDALEAILRRDVPVVPLYEYRELAAIDATLCGGTPHDDASWAWLADLYPCEEATRP